ncbi:hypothetical protein ACFL4K_00205 [Candidatus Neomarinimicrobiota bacterium]
MLRSHHLLLAYLVFLLVVIGLIEHAIQHTASSIIFGLSYLMIAFLLYLAILTKLVQGRFRLTPLFFPILLYFIWTLVTAIVNGVSLTVYLISVKDYIKYVLLFLAIVNLRLEEEQVWYLVKALFIILLFQIPVTIIQFLFIPSHPDHNCGTFGFWGTGQLMIWVVIAIIGLIGYINIQGNRRHLIYTAIGLFFIVPFLGSARAILYFLPLSFLFVALHYRQGRMLKYAVVLGSAFVVTIGITLWILGLGADDFRDLLWAGTQVSRLGAESIAGGSLIPGRFFDLIETLRVVSSSLKLALVGHGFGSNKLADLAMLGIGGMQALGTQSQLATTLIETGFVGLILYLMIVLRAYRSIRSLVRRVHTPYATLFGFVAFTTVFTYLLAISYHGIWYSTYSSLPFWIVMAFAYILQQQWRPEIERSQMTSAQILPDSPRTAK